MTSLVKFDQRGAFGPAITLIYNASYLNAKGVKDLANLLKENFMRLSGLKPKGKKEFCVFIEQRNQSPTPVTPAEVIATNFFQNMQKTCLTPELHEKVLHSIVPVMLKTAHEQIQPGHPDTTAPLKEWTARFVESYMTEEQISRHSAPQNDASVVIQEERKQIGMKLFQEAQTNRFTVKDLEKMVSISEFALTQIADTDHSASVLYFTGKYLTLFSMEENDPCKLGREVMELLSTIFKKKMFPDG